jgi:hypothetical protein
VLIQQGPMHECGERSFGKVRGEETGSSSGSALEGSAQKIVFQESTLDDRWL